MGVDVVVGGGAEEECLGELPALARLFPCFAGGFDVGGGEGAGGVFGLHGAAQVHKLYCGVGHGAVGGKHGVVYIVGDCVAEGLFFGCEGAFATFGLVAVGACCQRQCCYAGNH